MTKSAALPRFSYRPAEIAEATGVSRDTMYRLIRDEIIPTVAPRGQPRSTVYVLIPAWAYDTFQETGLWPGELPEDDQRRLPPSERSA